MRIPFSANSSVLFSTIKITTFDAVHFLYARPFVNSSIGNTQAFSLVAQVLLFSDLVLISMFCCKHFDQATTLIYGMILLANSLATSLGFSQTLAQTSVQEAAASKVFSFD